MATQQRPAQQQSTALTVPQRIDALPEVRGITPVARMLQGLTLDEFNALRDQYAKDTTMTEFKLYLLICAQRDLNPFANQIFCIVRGKGNNRKATNQVSIDGLRAIAKKGQYAGSGKPIWGPLVEETTVWEGKGKKRVITNDIPHPEWCEIITYTWGPRGEKVEHPAILYWDEFVPLQGDRWVDGQGYVTWKIPDTWMRMYRHMLAKCTEAASIRKGNPECSGFYLHEEMQFMDREAGPAGVTTVEQVAMADEHATTPQTTPEPDYIDADVVEESAAADASPSSGDPQLTEAQRDLYQFCKGHGITAQDVMDYLLFCASQKMPVTPEKLLANVRSPHPTALPGLYKMHFHNATQIPAAAIDAAWKAYLAECDIPETKDALDRQLDLWMSPEKKEYTWNRLMELAEAPVA